MTLSKAPQILIGQDHFKPLDPRPLSDPLSAKYNVAKYCAFHQQTSHDIDCCFCLRHEVQDLIDNKVIVSPGPSKSIGARSLNLGDNVTRAVIEDEPPTDGVHVTPGLVDGMH
ncbi:hypothetical protein HYC85_029454 [Camellia sinensis]|uniref:Uncharacterized protein n=1 Tax=Camellia sinensis TaxID=4442 RepID=A0A7J7FY05_CAMSI|nr:hypothetical protein HYC85_029454 [Camellia sinensis]